MSHHVFVESQKDILCLAWHLKLGGFLTVLQQISELVNCNLKVFFLGYNTWFLNLAVCKHDLDFFF